MMASPSLLPRCTPESQGVSSEAILRLLDAWEARSLELHSLLLLRRGHILAEGWWKPYRAATPHSLFSLTKSFTATAIGFALAEGHLTLDDPVLAFFPEEAPPSPSTYLRAMQLRHLLSMTTGHAADTETIDTGNKTHNFLSYPVEYAPGTHFIYNNGASRMLAAIVQNVTRQRVLEYLTPRLFMPLGIAEVTWDVNSVGIDDGARGLNLTTEAIARFGQLYLQQGVWNGLPLLSPEWIQAATSRQIIFPNRGEDVWHQGYGFQFWCGQEGLYMGAGAFGQYCIVVPQHETVIAITGGLQDTQPMLDLLHDHLLSALSATALPADARAHTALEQRLTKLRLPTPEGTSSSPIAATMSGRPFLLVPNPLGYKSIRFDFAAAAFCRIHIGTERGEHLLVGRMDGQWQRMRTRLNRDDPEAIAVQSVWTQADTFTFRFCSLDTPYCTTVTCRFDQQLLRLHCQRNVGHPSPVCTEILGWRREPLS